MTVSTNAVAALGMHFPGESTSDFAATYSAMRSDSERVRANRRRK
jgi:hypothetical protein